MNISIWLDSEISSYTTENIAEEMLIWSHVTQETYHRDKIANVNFLYDEARPPY